MAPSEDGAMRKIPEDVRAEEGRALARLGDGGWDPARPVGPARADASTTSWSTPRRRRCARWGVPVGWVTAVPSLRSGAAGPGLRAAARRGARACRTRRRSTRVADGPPQREMANSAQQVANVRGAFAVDGELPAGACLLVDDVRFSGWTLAMLAGQLRRRGAGAVYPFALASAI